MASALLNTFVLARCTIGLVMAPGITRCGFIAPRACAAVVDGRLDRLSFPPGACFHAGGSILKEKHIRTFGMPDRLIALHYALPIAMVSRWYRYWASVLAHCLRGRCWRRCLLPSGALSRLIYGACIAMTAVCRHRLGATAGTGDRLRATPARHAVDAVV
ncbi:MAG: hypothetical protein GPOALKHO_001105 [Sodalis sp.]|nr:MAG: hypothetical protein GPOALKHO_001105 [Sodalis sp.]